jgi:N-acetylmuramoyl-L-alanine amidase
MKRVFPLLLAFALVAPAAARAGDVTMVVRDVPLGPRSLQSAPSPIRFNLLGLHWQGTGGVDYRTRSPGGTWSPWSTADADSGPDEGSPERRQPGWQDGNLDWTGAATRVQYRRHGRVTRLRAYYLWSQPKKPSPRRLALAGSPSIVARSSWEADEKITRAAPLYARTLKLAVVHHTAGSNNYTRAQAAAIVRGIEVYHVKGNGWNDIGYNFLIDRFGTVYEGRAGGIERNVIGAHSLGFNSGTVGVALIGNHSRTPATKAEQDALVRLLAWRLDVAHIDPLSRVLYTSTGNGKFRAGKIVTLRAISGHRDTGPTDCPGSSEYAQLPAVARRVARTGLPKLYSVAASGALGGLVHFQGRLSSALPWTVTVTTATGKVVARGTGRSSTVDWTWSSARAGKGPFEWLIEAGPKLLPAGGSLGAPAARPRAPTPTPRAPTPTPRPPAPLGPLAPLPTPVPAPAPPPSAPMVVSALSVTPSTITPGANGAGISATVSFTLAAAAHVTVTVAASTGGPALLTLMDANAPAGHSSHQWNIGVLVNGRYKLSVSAQPRSGGPAVVETTDVVVDRTLGSFVAAPAAFSPNGDGVADTTGFTFLLTQPASLQLAIQRAGVTVAVVWTAQVGPGQQVIGWDGTSSGVRLPDGEYVAVLTATGPLGTVSLLQPLVIDTTPPVLTLLDGPSLRFDLNEAASISAVVNGQAVAVNQPRGTFTIPWSGGPVTTFGVQARDAAGNVGSIVTWP